MREEKGVIPSYGFLKWLADKYQFDLYAEHGFYNKECFDIESLSKEDFLQYASNFFGLAPSILIGRRKFRDYADARMLCYKFLCEKTLMSLREIGIMFGGRDHSTILHSRDEVSALMETDKKLEKRYADFCAFLGVDTKPTSIKTINQFDKEKKSLQRMSDRTIYLVGGKVLRVCKPKQDPFQKEEVEPQRAEIS